MSFSGWCWKTFPQSTITSAHQSGNGPVIAPIYQASQYIFIRTVSSKHLLSTLHGTVDEGNYGSIARLRSRRYSALWESFPTPTTETRSLITLKLVDGPFGQSNIHSTLDFFPRPARKETNVPLHKKSQELTILMYKLCQPCLLKP